MESCWPWVANAPVGMMKNVLGKQVAASLGAIGLVHAGFILYTVLLFDVIS